MYVPMIKHRSMMPHRCGSSGSLEPNASVTLIILCKDKKCSNDNSSIDNDNDKIACSQHYMQLMLT
jgi:hypothetical protein